jgi:hypothetical protein|tara:strand:+ start:43 stop:435 length:393 start_codon:yes stop_codon:yes gene_type:complete
MASKFIRGIFKIVKGGKTSPTISSTTINVGNLKKNKETLDKLIKTTDAYVTKAGKVDPSLKESLRKAGSKSLQKTDKILRKGGRKNLKFGGGADAGKIPTTPKEKKFAAIAEPKNRITYRDKIEGAKKRG